MSTLAVVEGILRQAEVPMSVREIVERAGEALPTKSKTPDTVVARDLSMDIKKKGDGSIFIRTSPGRYAVREVFEHRMARGSVGPNDTHYQMVVTESRPMDLPQVPQAVMEIESTATSKRPDGDFSTSN